MRIPVLTAVCLILFPILLDLYIFCDIRSYVPQKRRKAAEWVHGALSVLLWVFIIVVICLPKREYGEPIIGAMWMLYAFATVYLAKAFYALSSLIGRLVARIRHRKGMGGIYTGVVLGAMVLGVCWWGALVNRYQIDVEHTEISYADLPAAFDGYRIVQFSDAHVGTWGSDTAFVSRLVDSINAQNADMIVFTGDFVNRETRELKPFVDVLSRLHARDGVYSILGNHDYGDYIDWPSPDQKAENNRRLAAMQKQMGWQLLKNEYRMIPKEGDSIALIGVENWGEPPFKVYGDLKASYPADGARHLNDSVFKILLTHNPMHWTNEVTKKSNVNLTLSGHTHAMQTMVRVGEWKWSPCVWRYKTWGGLYADSVGKKSPMYLYVNIGCGEVGMPARIGATPEVTVINLRRK